MCVRKPGIVLLHLAAGHGTFSASSWVQPWSWSICLAMATPRHQKRPAYGSRVVVYVFIYREIIQYGFLGPWLKIVRNQRFLEHLKYLEEDMYRSALWIGHMWSCSTPVALGQNVVEPCRTGFGQGQGQLAGLD